jgi:hypothetical protein
MKNKLNILIVALVGLVLFSCVKDEPFPAPPLVSNFEMTPMAPEEDEPVVIKINVADINGVESVKLFYKINNGAYTTVDMTASGNIYSATIPGQPVTTLVHYYVEAKNIIDKTTYFPATAPAEPAMYEVGGALLIHYWHFNQSIIENDMVPSDFSLVGSPVISYPGQGAGYMDFRTYRAADPVSNFNLQLGEGPDQGAVLRVRNPANTRELIIEAPSTGYEKLVVAFAVTRSGSGGQEQEFYYSADGGANWVMVGQAYGVTEIDSSAENFGYVHKTFDLSAVASINNNGNLKFRIMAVGEGADGGSGNQRFDNLTVMGEKL